MIVWIGWCSPRGETEGGSHRNPQMKSKAPKISAKNRGDDPKSESAERSAAPPERMSAILDEIPVQAWCSLPDGTMEFRNRAWVEYAGGKSRSGREGWSDTVHKDDRKHCTKAWSEIRASGTAG